MTSNKMKTNEWNIKSLRSRVAVLCCLLILPRCTKSTFVPGRVISDLQFSTYQILADGASTISIQVAIDNNADSNKRIVLISASDGSFMNGKDS
jgi:hypothetical protein